MRRVAGAMVWLAACLAWTGCISIGPPLWIDVPASSGVDSKQAGSFLAGAAAVDITPIPGVPLGGHSIDGKASRGFWTRLRARALYLVDPKGIPLVLIATDLGAIPGGLGDEVARLLHQDYGMPWIGREHVLLAATHTHHGPGNFYTQGLWNDSISPWTGFDRALFDFLARRIAFAAAAARQAAQPAELLATDASALEASKLWKLDKFFRNRSLPAFLLNPKATSLLDPDVSNTCAPWHEDPDPRACQAVRPQVELLAIRPTSSAAKILGVAAFVPVHPTVLPSRLEVYSADLFGVASAQLEQSTACPELAANSVVAFFNGAEGDVSPTWDARNRAEVLDLGGRLANKVCTLLGHLKPVANPGIRVAFDRVPLANQVVVGDPILDPTGNETHAERRTDAQGSPGAATAGGAEDGRSLLYGFLGHREGKTLVARRDHGPKSPVGQIEGMGINLDVLTLWKKPPPGVAPLAVYAIGGTSPNVVIAAVPGEFTTQMGERVRRAVWNALPSTQARPAKPDHVLVVGLANEYIGYFATPEEYDAQHYEGAMTLWGAASGPLLAQKLAGLAANAGSSAAKAPIPWPASWLHPYCPGPPASFQPKDVRGALQLEDDGLADLLAGPPDATRARRDLPVYCWRDAVPRLESVGGEMCQRSNPEVSIHESPVAGLSPKRVTDNFGVDLVTVVTGVGRDQTGDYHTNWCAIWLGAPERIESAATREYWFEVEPLSGVVPPSKTFSLVDNDGDGWLDERFVQAPPQSLDSTLATLPLPMGNQCTVPGPS